MKSDILLFAVQKNVFKIKRNDEMIICIGDKIHDLDYDVIRHWIHLRI